MFFYYFFLATIVLIQISTSAQQTGYDYNQPNQQVYQQNNYPSGLDSTAPSGRFSEPVENYDNTNSNNNNYQTTGFSNDNNNEEKLSSQLPQQNSNEYYNNDNDSENIIIEPKIRYNNGDQADQQTDNGNDVLNNGGANNSNEGNKNDFSGIPGLPGVDYPVYSEIPKTTFSCGDKSDGFYADVEAKCQLFHRCVNKFQYDFLCPNGTIYNQQHLVCVWWNEFDCETAPSFFDRNDFSDSESSRRFGEKSSGNKDLTSADFPATFASPDNNNNGSNESQNQNNFENGVQQQQRSGKTLDFVPIRQSKISPIDFDDDDDDDGRNNDGNIDYDGESLLTAEGDFSRNLNKNNVGGSGGGGDDNDNNYGNENTKNNRFRNNNYREGSFSQRKPPTGFATDYSQQKQLQPQPQQRPIPNYRTDRIIEPPSKLYLPPLV